MAPEIPTLIGNREVEKLVVKPEIKLGEGFHGKVLLAKLKMKGERSRPVAIKFYNSGFEPKDADITRMAMIIHDFQKAGVRMPKFGLVTFQGKNVLLSTAFVKKKGNRTVSTLTELANFTNLNFTDMPEFTKELAGQLGRVLNSGWVPAQGLEHIFHSQKTADGHVPILGEVEPAHFIKASTGIAMLNASSQFFEQFSQPSLRVSAARAFLGQLDRMHLRELHQAISAEHGTNAQTAQLLKQELEKMRKEHS